MDQIEAGRELTGPRGSYIVEQEWGRGGFAVTYRARRSSDGLAVIVKVLRLDRLQQWKAVELFEREAAVLRSLSHPGIPGHVDDFVLGTTERPAGFALVEEWIPGQSLYSMLRSGERLEPGDMLGWLRDLLDILRYLHRLSPPVIHRDVTPKNILVRPDGRAALIDFGSVQAALQSPDSISSTSAGTFGYAPPEQFVGRATPACDLYGAAMSFLAVWSGLDPEHMPFDGARVDVPRLLDADRDLVDLLHSMTEPDPRRRLGDAAVAQARLSRLLGRGPDATATDVSQTALATRAAEPALARDVDGYVALLEARLRREGFAVVEGASVGGQRVRLAAHEKGRGAGGASATYVYVTRDHDLPRERNGRPSLAAFARDLEAAHADKSSGFDALLRGRTLVLGLVVAEAGAASLAPPGGLRALTSRRVVTIPVLVELAEGTVELGRLGAQARGLRAALPYYWWLAAPRLLDRPRLRPRSSLGRVALAVGVGGVLMFAVAALYAVSQAVTAFNHLMIAADPATRTLVVKAYTYGKEPGKGLKAMTLSAAGESISSRELPADGYLCGFDGDALVYLMPDESVWRADRSGGEPRRLARLPAGTAHCAVRGEQIAFDTGKPPRVYLRSPDGEIQPAKGSVRGDNQPHWFPSGSRLVVANGPTGERRIVVIDLEQGSRDIVSDGGGSSAVRDDVFPIVSPDGARVLFTRIGRRATGDQAKFNRDTDRMGDLFVLDLATKQATLLVQDTCGVGPRGWLGRAQVVLLKWTGEVEGCGPYLFDIDTGDMIKLADYTAYD